MSNFLAISTQFNGQALNLFTNCESNTQWWDENPILLTSEEQKNIDLGHICTILTNRNISPWNVSGLSGEKINDPVINKIETTYQYAIEKYSSMIRKAVKQDAETAKQLNADFAKKISEQTDQMWKSIGIGSMFFLVGAVPGYFIGLKKAQEQNEQNNTEKLEILRKNSEHRRKLLVEIEEMEKNRHIELKQSLQVAAKATYEEFDKKMSCDIYDDFLLKKYQCYEKIYRTFFPNSSLIYDNSEDKKHVCSVPSELSLLSQELQSWIGYKFFSSVFPIGNECGKLMLSLLDKTKECDAHVVNSFFLEITKIKSFKSIKKQLTKVGDIFEKGFAAAFFQYVSSKKSSYYAASALVLMIDDFSKITKVIPTMKLQSPVRSYEEGGKEHLRVLKKQISESFHLSQMKEETEFGFIEIKKKTEQVPIPEIREDTLGSLEEKFSNDRTVSCSLGKEKLSIVLNQYTKIIELCKKWERCSIEELVESAHRIAKNSTGSEEKIIQFAAIGLLAIFHEFRKFLYPEQVLTVLGQLTFHSGCVAQVKTGKVRL